MHRYLQALILTTCAMLAFGSAIVPDRAEAQVSCPATAGNSAAIGAVFAIRGFPGDCSSTNLQPADYTGAPGPTGQFQLFLPGDKGILGDTNPLKIFVENASGTALNITRLVCAGGTIGGVGSTVGTVALDDGESCLLYAFWENGSDDISFSGATLSRTGVNYAIDGGGIISGDQFGGEANPTIGVGRGSVTIFDGDSDDQGPLTPGTPTTLTYTITNLSQIDQLRIFNIYSEGVDSSTISGPTITPSVSLTHNLSPRGSMTFDVEFTPLQSTGFSFDIVIVNEGDLVDEMFRLTISGSGQATDTGDNGKARTKRIIANFLGRRGAQIVSNEPDLTKRLGDGGQRSAGPVDVTGEGTANTNSLAFATSLRQVVRSQQRARQKHLGDGEVMMALGNGKRGAKDRGSLKDAPYSADGSAAKPFAGFGLWAEGTWARIEDDTAESDFGLLYVGADYRFNAGLVVGIIAQFDTTDEKDATNDFAIDGKGWMAGPYIVARLSSKLIFDARAAWGRSDNTVSPFNTYSDEFEGKRWLVRSRLTGDFTFGSIHVAPHVGIIYFEEEQQAYTDSFGNTIEAQTVELGRLTFGPKFSTSFNRPDGTTIAPFIAIQGIWDFKRSDPVDIDTGLAVTGSDDFRARAEAGLSVRLPAGVAITGEGFYDGIGANGTNAYGGGFKVGVPF